MIVLSEIQRDPTQVEKLPTLLKPSAAKKKAIPQWAIDIKARTANITEAELLIMVDEALASMK